MIFFTNGTEFNTESGMSVVPFSVELKDGRKGYYLSEKWKPEIESRGITIEPITKNDLKIDDDFGNS